MSFGTGEGGGVDGVRPQDVPICETEQSWALRFWQYELTFYKVRKFNFLMILMKHR